MASPDAWTARGASRRFRAPVMAREDAELALADARALTGAALTRAAARVAPGMAQGAGARARCGGMATASSSAASRGVQRRFERRNDGRATRGEDGVTHRGGTVLRRGIFRGRERRRREKEEERGLGRVAGVFLGWAENLTSRV